MRKQAGKLVFDELGSHLAQWSHCCRFMGDVISGILSSTKDFYIGWHNIRTGSDSANGFAKHRCVFGKSSQQLGCRITR